MDRVKVKGWKRWSLRIAVAAFWLAVWQIASMAVSQELLLASPLQTLKVLIGMIAEGDFWITIATSFVHITSGFLLGLTTGILFAVAAYRSRVFKALMSPILKLMKAIPVASFIILLLLWMDSESLPTAAVFVMLLPVIYVNVLQGIESTDVKLLEMADVFSIKGMNRIRYIYVPAVMPHFVSACSLALGFSWKSGVAAEVIALSPDSIGRQLYNAKLYLMTGELFAWTAVIIVISVAFERIIMLVLGRTALHQRGKVVKHGH